MKTSLRTLVLVTVVAAGGVVLESSPARAQAFGFGYAGPGVSFGVGTGPYGGAAFYGGGYPVVARPPVVVAPPPLVVAPPPVVVARPFVVPAPFYGYPRGAYRPYPYRYYRR